MFTLYLLILLQLSISTYSFASSNGYYNHLVKKGDSLAKIATYYRLFPLWTENGSVMTLWRLNSDQIKNPNSLTINSSLKIYKLRIPKVRQKKFQVIKKVRKKIRKRKKSKKYKKRKRRKKLRAKKRLSKSIQTIFSFGAGTFIFNRNANEAEGSKNVNTNFTTQAGGLVYLDYIIKKRRKKFLQFSPQIEIRYIQSEVLDFPLEFSLNLNSIYYHRYKLNIYPYSVMNYNKSSYTGNNNEVESVITRSDLSLGLGAFYSSYIFSKEFQLGADYSYILSGNSSPVQVQSETGKFTGSQTNFWIWQRLYSHWKVKFILRLHNRESNQVSVDITDLQLQLIYGF